MGNYTVASWLRTWYGVYAEPRIRPNTREYYKNYINNHIVPALGDILLDKLVTLQIQRFYNGLQKNGRVQRKGFPAPKDKSLSPRVVRGVHTLLSNCLDQAVAERLILANPAAGEDRAVSGRGRAARTAGHLLSGVDHRSASGRAVSPKVVKFRCRGKNHLRHQTGEPHQR